MSRRRSTSLLLVVLCAVALCVAGCAEGELENDEIDDNQTEDVGVNQNQAEDTGPNGDEDAGPDDNDEPKPTADPTEAHQICAAAGETADGDVQSLHCLGPHDISGFEATDGDRTWEPGAFRVVAE